MRQPVNNFPQMIQAPARRAVFGGVAAALGMRLTRTAAAATVSSPPVGSPSTQPAQSVPTLTIGYIHWQHDVEAISLIFTPAANDGRSGAEVGVADNNTTGRFLGQNFALDTIEVRTEQDPAAALDTLIRRGIRLVITDRPAADVLKLADAGAPHGVTVFNVGAPDNSIRESDCRANLIHTAPSNAMLADALAQYLVWKRWSRWLLAYGTQPDDLLLADAYRRAAKTFGARIVAERQYKAAAGSRETDSGLIDLQKQLPVFTQNAPEYDVLVCADQNSAFAGYLPYRTWDSRPVAGSAGLIPTSWDPNIQSSAASRCRTGSMATPTAS